MFRSLAFIPVGQKEREPAQAAPLGFAGRDELVDDDLCAVREIPELALPDDQCFRRGSCVAVFEGKNGLL